MEIMKVHLKAHMMADKMVELMGIVLVDHSESKMVQSLGYLLA